MYNTADFSVRGFVIDIFPVGEENPVRIEMFDNEIEKIKYFDSMTQRTTSEIKEITISSLNENFNDNDTSIREYMNNKIVIFHNFNQIKLQEKLIQPQLYRIKCIYN